MGDSLERAARLGSSAIVCRAEADGLGRSGGFWWGLVALRCEGGTMSPTTLPVHSAAH